MLYELLHHLKNWFVVPDGIHFGKYTVEKGSIELPFLLPGQYFRICGSVFNDGVYKYPEAGLTDETFIGAVWALAVPAAVVDLAHDIEIYEAQAGGSPSPYISESFAGYSYTRATNSTTGQAASWKDVFRSRLNQWRKI